MRIVLVFVWTQMLMLLLSAGCRHCRSHTQQRLPHQPGKAAASRGRAAQANPLWEGVPLPERQLCRGWWRCWRELQSDAHAAPHTAAGVHLPFLFTLGKVTVFHI